MRAGSQSRQPRIQRDSVDTEVMTAGALPTLIDLSKEADMIVVGCRGLGAIGRRLLGSVSWGLVHHAHCPVAVIHDEDPLMPYPARLLSWWVSTVRRHRSPRRRSPSTRHHAEAWSSSPSMRGAIIGLELPHVVGHAETGRRDSGRTVGGMAGALPRCEGATCRGPGPAGASIARAVGVRAIDGCRQPRPWRLRRDVARFGQLGCRRVGSHAGDRGPAVLTPVRRVVIPRGGGAISHWIRTPPPGCGVPYRAWPTSATRSS